MLKLILILTVFIIASCAISKNGDTEVNVWINPIDFNENIATAIINGDHECDWNLYLARKELERLIKTVGSESPQNISEKELKNYRSNKKKFAKNYSNNFKSFYLSMSGCTGIDWKKCSIDSSTYEYNIRNFEGKDKRITWPESKNYQPTNDQLISCKGLVFISQDSNQYALQIQTCYYQGMWKFYNSLRAPRITRIQ